MGRWVETEVQCGLDYTDIELEAFSLVNARIFPDAPRPDWSAPTLGVEVLPSYDGLYASAATASYLLTTSGDGEGGVSVTWHEPLTGVEVATDVLTICPQGRTGCDYAVIPGTGVSWILARESQRLWLLDDGGERELENPCDMAEAPFAILSGVAWWMSAPSLTETRMPSLAGCVLETGEHVAVEAPELAFPLESEWGEQRWFTPTAIGQHPTAWWPDAGIAWWTGEGWEQAAMPWFLSVLDTAVLSDGRLLLGIQNYTHTEGVSLLNLATFDPETGALEAGEVQCTASPSGAWLSMLAGDGWAVFQGSGWQVTPVRLRD